MDLAKFELLDEASILGKMQIVDNILTDKKVLVAFSGGVDSSVLGLLAKLYAKEVLLVMQEGYSVGIGEVDLAETTANILSLPLRFIHYNEYELSREYRKNPNNRCYYCKELLHDQLEKLRSELGYDYVLNGTNASDLNGHRPGFQAIQEKNAKSPLVSANLNKSEIRWIARKYKLPVWDKPATACLASRFKTGTPITKSGLQRVAEAEYFIKSNFDINILRVRDDGENARIEVGIDEIWKLKNPKVFVQIVTKLVHLGYKQVKLDNQGYRPNVPLSD